MRNTICQVSPILLNMDITRHRGCFGEGSKVKIQKILCIGLQAALSMKLLM